MTAMYDMLKALYDFKGTLSKTLSFSENDYFLLHHISTKQKKWWLVIDSKAQVGYVPSNYVAEIKVNTEEWLKFVKECLDVLRMEQCKGGGVLAPERLELLLKLSEYKDLGESNIFKQQSAVYSHYDKGHAPSPPFFQYANGEPQGNSPELAAIKGEQAGCLGQGDLPESMKAASPRKIQVTQRPTKNVKILNVQTSKSVSSHPQNKTQKLTRRTMSSLAVLDGSVNKDSSDNEDGIEDSEAAYHIVEQVRRNTQMSHDLSRIAVSVVLDCLCDLLPSSLTSYLDGIMVCLQGPLIAPKPVIEETYDANRLRVIFNELTTCKDDSQQRSWMLYEDEAIIKEHIKELTSILTNADSNISRHIMATDQYQGVISLIQYYQMEIRWSIRHLLLQSLGIMCNLDATIVTIILNSVLPMELARDMVSNARNIPRLNYSVLLLTMLFSMGESMPVTHLEHLGEDFICFILDLIESPPDTDIEEQIPDLFLNFILSYNLQFPSPSQNVLLKALIKKNVAKTFTEKILLLLNREEDPVRIFEHQPAPPHSVLKLFVDLFSNDKTSVLFYTNDTKVLIDIIVRQLSDLSPGNKKRHLYLELCRSVVRNTPYAEHLHRRDDILKAFTRIFCEENEHSIEDQKLVREISNEFPQYFRG